VDINAVYEQCVQDPRRETNSIHSIFRELTGKRNPLSLREDFCGTAILCREWVSKSSERWAVGVDIDPGVLKWGQENRLDSDASVSARVKLFEADVMTAQGVPKTEILVALNYGVCFFPTFSKLVAYLKRCHEALQDGGMFVCDLFGGYKAQMGSEKVRQHGDVKV